MEQLRRQLEFYFTDSNYRRDAFLQGLEDEDGWIGIHHILSFNKIKSLTKDTGKIREALQRSELVEVHPADDKLKKKRFVTTAADSDRKTVYIEGFALNDNHDTLAKRFSAIGNVKLVSMPRHTGTRKFKGFAFVEFDSIESVSDACRIYSGEEGWLVVTKIEWIQTRKRYGRIREKHANLFDTYDEGDADHREEVKHEDEEKAHSDQVHSPLEKIETSISSLTDDLNRRDTDIKKRKTNDDDVDEVTSVNGDTKKKKKKTKEKRSKQTDQS